MQENTSAQECSPPIVNSFVQQGSDAVEVKWLDTNPIDVTGSYAIRYRQMSDTDETTIDNLITKSKWVELIQLLFSYIIININRKYYI